MPRKIVAAPSARVPQRARLGAAATYLCRCLGLSLGTLLPFTASAQASPHSPGGRSLDVKDLLATRNFVLGSAVALSPDGRWVAYAVGVPKLRRETKYLVYDSTGAPAQLGRSELSVTDTRTGHTVTISAGAIAHWQPAWSPDGRYLAFCSTRDGMARLWTWEPGTGALRRAGSATVLVPTTSPQPPRWMPDSRNVLVKVLPSEITVDQLITHATAPKTPVENSIIGTGIEGSTVTAYVSPASSRGPGSSEAMDTNAIHQDSGARIDRGDLALIDIVTGSVQLLTHRTHPSWYMPSPNGQMVAFTENRGLRGGNNWRPVTDLYVTSVHDTIPRLLVAALQQFTGTISWSPNSQWLAYTQLGKDVDGDLHIVPVAGGPARNISRGPHASFNFISDEFGAARLPLWKRDGTAIYMLVADTVWRATLQEGRARAVAHIPGQELVEVVTLSDGRYWSPNGGRSIYVKIRDSETKAMGYAQLDLESGRVMRRVTEPKSYGAFEWLHLGEAAANSSEFVYVAEDAGHAPDIWLSDTAFAIPRQLSRLNAHLDPYTMGVSRVVTWQGLDGQQLHGALLLPADYRPGQRYPLIVKLCGGVSCSSAVHQFGLTPPHVLENMQLFATRGYAVLVPDAPQETRTPMADLAKAVLPGINRVAELGIADPDRLGVMGHSYGGYSTLALLVQTPRFRAAAISAAPANWFSLHGELSPTGDAWGIGVTEDGQGLMRGTPWEKRDKYIENSPYFYLDRIQTPVLLMHGTADEGVFSYNSDEVFVGLRRLGKAAVYLKYAGEGHLLHKLENRIDYLTRLVAWFDAHLKPPEGHLASPEKQQALP